MKGICYQSPACDGDVCRCEEYDREMKQHEVDEAIKLLQDNGYEVIPPKNNEQ